MGSAQRQLTDSQSYQSTIRTFLGQTLPIWSLETTRFGPILDLSRNERGEYRGSQLIELS